ncbi:MAG: hypothetical protein JNG90_10710 [Planctomycetaceae bacterium]|nr:hypothetical protein [Planctomycetaceae bacterium]
MRTQRSWLGGRSSWGLVFALAALGATGCDGPRRSAPTGASTTIEAPPAAAEPAPATAAVEPAAPPSTVQKPADVGAGKRGHDLGQGIIATPVAAYFAAQEQVAFRVEVPQAMNLFKAEKGYAPRSNEEFMKDIIQANNIKLPELPAGHKYIYDPVQEQLMVEQPGQ